MSTDTKILLGMKIRNIRDTAKLTQGEFGHIVGIDEKTISNIENGKNYPSFATICSIIQCFKVEPNYLLDFIKYDSTVSDTLNSLIIESLKNCPDELKRKDKIKFGKRIKELRVAQGLSQDDLCNKVEGLEPSYLSKIETGKYAPALPTFFKIINALETNPDNFFDYKHLVTEKELDSALLHEYKELPLKKKRILYRYIQILKEYN